MGNGGGAVGVGCWEGRAVLVDDSLERVVNDDSVSGWSEHAEDEREGLGGAVWLSNEGPADGLVS